MRAAMEAVASSAAALPDLRAARRVVVKVGSALVVDEGSAAPREAWLASVAAEFDGIHNIHRAVDVGSVDEVIEAHELRPKIIAAIERGLADVGGAP